MCDGDPCQEYCGIMVSAWPDIRLAMFVEYGIGIPFGRQFAVSLKLL